MLKINILPIVKSMPLLLEWVRILALNEPVMQQPSFYSCLGQISRETLLTGFESRERVNQSLRLASRSLTALVVVVTATWALRDYAKWRSLGPGGLPSNAIGWLKMTRLRLLAVNELDEKPIRAMCGVGQDLQAWIKSQQRSGPRPIVGPYPIPHRQVNQLPNAAQRAGLAQLFQRKVHDQADHVEYVHSHYEKRNFAITLKHSASQVGGLAHGEIAHFHPSDNSMHIVLSPTDAVAAIEMGWAQRHGLAGRAVGLPPTYVLVYAPRNDDDLHVIEGLLHAAIAYAIQPNTKTE